MTSDLIRTYFPQISDEQQRQFDALDGLYRDWNAKINVISRKDIDNLYEHHVLHSLSIAKVVNFRPGTSILDFGTGGGFPGIGNQGTVYRGVYMNANITNLENQTMLVYVPAATMTRSFRTSPTH